MKVYTVGFVKEQKSRSIIIEFAADGELMIPVCMFKTYDLMEDYYVENKLKIEPPEGFVLAMIMNTGCDNRLDVKEFNKLRIAHKKWIASKN